MQGLPILSASGESADACRCDGGQPKNSTGPCLLPAEAPAHGYELREPPADGSVEPRGEPFAERYRLTPLGLREGGRRFAAESAGLTRQAHGECGPGCWCQDPEHEGDLCPAQQPRLDHDHAHA